jgi:hypothetical protein
MPLRGKCCGIPTRNLCASAPLREPTFLLFFAPSRLRVNKNLVHPAA